MKIIQTSLKNCYVIEPLVIEDERGYFYEKFNQKVFEEFIGTSRSFVQHNISKSTYGVLRGIHLQKGDHAQAKLVSCLQGCVWDVVVDLRVESLTFGKWFGVELSGDNKLQMYVPRGFGHGFSVLSREAIFSYKCDNFYSKESEGSIIWNDPDLDIDWKLSKKAIILSEKDKKNPRFSERNF